MMILEGTAADNFDLGPCLKSELAWLN